MAMAMGVASLAVTAPKHAALVTPRAATNRGEKQGFLDWFRTAMDKDSLSETDAVLAKGNEDGKSNEDSKSSGKSTNFKSSNGKSTGGVTRDYPASSAPKKGPGVARDKPPSSVPKKGPAAPPKRGGFSFFGKK